MVREMDGVHEHHEELVSGLLEQLRPIFAQSEQGIYIYLDDLHKACNNKFAQMLGYGSAEEWTKEMTNFPDVFVDDESQQVLIETYRQAVDKMVAAKIDVIWKKKDGKRVSTEVILVPITYGGCVFGLHFVAINV